MPHKPKRPCRWPGCSELSDGPYCPEHQKQMDAHYNRYQRDPESRHRYGRAWRQIRDRHLKQHPLCEMCLKAGRYTRPKRSTTSYPSREVVHTTHLT